MSKVLCIDPGKSKCGLILANIREKKVCKAEVIETKYFIKYVKKIYQNEQNLQLLIGNGTSSQNFINDLRQFVPDLLVVEEKNSTYRAKQRYFEIFPPAGLKVFLPREIFILNKNLDALAALIIMEDYYDLKFEMSQRINTKTWLK